MLSLVVVLLGIGMNVGTSTLRHADGSGPSVKLSKVNKSTSVSVSNSPGSSLSSVEGFLDPLHPGVKPVELFSGDLLTELFSASVDLTIFLNPSNSVFPDIVKSTTSGSVKLGVEVKSGDTVVEFSEVDHSTSAGITFGESLSSQISVLDLHETSVKDIELSSVDLSSGSLEEGGSELLSHDHLLGGEAEGLDGLHELCLGDGTLMVQVASLEGFCLEG